MVLRTNATSSIACENIFKESPLEKQDDILQH